MHAKANVLESCASREKVNVVYISIIRLYFARLPGRKLSSVVKRFEGILSIAEDEKENDDNDGDEDADDIFVCLWAPKSRKACDTNTHTHKQGCRLNYR